MPIGGAYEADAAVIDELRAHGRATDMFIEVLLSIPGLTLQKGTNYCLTGNMKKEQAVHVSEAAFKQWFVYGA